jgi:hypothetical protein
MSDYDNSNRGSIWKKAPSERKTDNHPHYGGSAEVGGVEYWVSGWLKKSTASDKAPAMSFSFTPKEFQSAPPTQQNKSQSIDADEFEDINF